MAIADGSPAGFAREHPRALTAVFTALGYVLIVGTLSVGLPIYPRISAATVDLLSHLIAAINSVTVVMLAVGWYAIRTGRVRRHRAAMVSAFVLILLFLVLYLLKTGGGGRKEVIGGPAVLQSIYLAALGAHILLSMVAVPVVVYAITLGLTHTPSELRRETPHRRVGQWAAGTWMVSLVLGIVAYVLLNHVLNFEFVRLVVVP